MSPNNSNLEVFPHAAALERLINNPCPNGLHGAPTPPDENGEVMYYGACPVCHQRVATMAQLFLMTCPSERGDGGSLTQNILSNMAKGNPICCDSVDISSMIGYRWKLGQLADHVVQLFGLTAPNNQTCMMWIGVLEWMCRRQAHPSTVVNRLSWLRVLGIFWQNRPWLEPLPNNAQGRSFRGFGYYLAAAVIETNLPADEAGLLATRVRDFVQQCPPIPCVSAGVSKPSL